MEGAGVLLGQGLSNGGQVQLLRQALDKFQIHVVVAHKPVHSGVYIYVVSPQYIQTALHLIHKLVVPFFHSFGACSAACRGERSAEHALFRSCLKKDRRLGVLAYFKQALSRGPSPPAAGSINKT